MIRSLHLQNFRSVHEAVIEFSETKLTVIVGANGSGKTNVVRALELIAEMQHGDLSSAISAQGGQRSIIPKAINYRQLLSTETYLSYQIGLPIPKGYRENFSHPCGVHTIRFKIRHRNAVRIVEEELEFTQPLAVAEALNTQNQNFQEPIRKWSRGRQSSIRFIRTHEDKISTVTTPKFSNANLAGYLEWFGFGFLEKSGIEISSIEDFLVLMKDLNEQLTHNDRILRQWETLIKGRQLFFPFAAQASIFRNIAQSMQRFDFHVETLRGDQQPSSDTALTSIGEHLPAAVRWMEREKEQRPQWEKILDTLQNITPFIFDIRSNILRSGREYIEFFETRTGRPVESWDASDGILRALAILIAIESHPSNCTLIIEEPEKGLHPWAIRYLFEHIRDAIERRNIQVVVTTHSPQVLESATAQEVIVATRTIDQGTILTNASNLIPGGSVPMGELGRLWVKGLIGGFPQDV